MPPRVEPVCPEPKVFVGQVPPTITREDLVALFGQYGEVKKCNLITGPDGRSRGCSMVTFEKWAQAEKAVEAEHGTTHFGGDRPLVVKFADPPKRGDGPVVGIAPKKLFVGQVPLEVTEDELRNIFAQYGSITELHVLHKTQGSGCAFVTYLTWAEAEAAIEGTDGKIKFPTAKASLIVKFADAKVPQNASRAGEKRSMYGGDLDWQGPNKKTYPGAGMMPQPGALYSPPGGRNGAMLNAYGGEAAPMGRGFGPAQPMGRPGGMPGANVPMNANMAGGMPGGMMGVGPGPYGDMGGMGAGPGGMGPDMDEAMNDAGLAGGMGGMGGMGGVGGAGAGPHFDGGYHHMGGGAGGGGGMDGGGLRGDVGGLAMGPGPAGGMGPMPGGPPAYNGGPGAGAMGPPHGVMPGQGMDRHGAPGGGYGPQGGGYGAQGLKVDTGGAGLPGMDMGGPGGPGSRMAAPPTSQFGVGGRLGSGVPPSGESKKWKLFVGQVPFNAVENDLWPVFAPLGDIQEMVILKGPDGRSKGCAFVTYATQPQAEQAILHLNGKSLPNDTRGKMLLVKFANVR